MDKFLFTDGTNGVKEVHSREELLALVQSATHHSLIRIWPFGSNAWMTWPAFQSAYAAVLSKSTLPLATAPSPTTSRSPKKYQPWLLLPALLIGALLIFNFTSADWKEKGTLSASSPRPENVPLMDQDSLASEIEMLRGKALDKSTRHNLRLRNNWPDFILLQFQAKMESKGKNNRFREMTISLDNASGAPIDQAVVRIEAWKNGKAIPVDTLVFNQIRYDKIRTRSLDRIYKADSLSLSFLQIRARAFNFCYQSTNNHSSGNPNDRWFCRDGKPNP